MTDEGSEGEETVGEGRTGKERGLKGTEEHGMGREETRREGRREGEEGRGTYCNPVNSTVLYQFVG